MIRRMNLAVDPVYIPSPRFVDLGLSTINKLDKGASIWTPAAIVGRLTYVSHCSAPRHILEKLQCLETL